MILCTTPEYNAVTFYNIPLIKHSSSHKKVWYFLIHELLNIPLYTLVSVLKLKCSKCYQVKIETPLYLMSWGH